MYHSGSLKFAESFTKDIETNAYEKDCLPNQGFPIKHRCPNPQTLELFLVGLDAAK